MRNFFKKGSLPQAGGDRIERPGRAGRADSPLYGGWKTFQLWEASASLGRDSTNTGWRVGGFRAYADYMQTQEFEVALRELPAEAARSIRNYRMPNLWDFLWTTRSPIAKICASNA